MSNLLLNKSSFIHIPKCGGTVVQNLLFRLKLAKKRYNSPQNGHLFLHQMIESENTYNFCFVRHPYTWWPSFWQWSKQDRLSLMERTCPDFDTWVQEYGPFWMGHYSKLVSRYTGDDPLYNSNIKMNFIGKTENLFGDLHKALTLAEEEFAEKRFQHLLCIINTDPKLLKSKNMQEYNRTISDKSKEIIYKTEKYMFDKFNYEP
jgi:hypothetical protein